MMGSFGLFYLLIISFPHYFIYASWIVLSCFDVVIAVDMWLLMLYNKLLKLQIDIPLEHADGMFPDPFSSIEVGKNELAKENQEKEEAVVLWVNER